VTRARSLGAFLLVIATLAYCPRIPPQTKSVIIETTVCAIAAKPEHFTGKDVAISGELHSVPPHWTTIVNRKCPDVGIQISTPNHFKGEADFVKAVNQGYLGTWDRTIIGTFVGRFVWRPKEVPNLVLVLKEARDLSVAMK
jgi:hypothetical protein